MSRVKLVAFALVLAATSLFAQSPNLYYGKTFVTLNTSFVQAAGSLGLSLGTVYPTRIVGATADFPITGGTIELDNAAGQILHSGGLTISKGATRLRLQDYIIDTTGSSPVITGIAVLNGKVLGRIPIFNVVLPSGFTLPLRPTREGILDLKGLGVTLTGTAATALNGVFGTTAFTPNFGVGTARVVAATRLGEDD